MNKIITYKKRKTANRRTRNISSILLNEEEISEYLEFNKNDHGYLIDSPLAQRGFERDKERDIAIISLIQGTGMRVGEIASRREKVHLLKSLIKVELL